MLCLVGMSAILSATLLIASLRSDANLAFDAVKVLRANAEGDLRRRQKIRPEKNIGWI